MWAFSWKQCWGGWKGQRYGVPPQAFLGLSSSHWLTFKNKEFDRTLEGMHNVIGWCYESSTRLVGEWSSLRVMHYYLNLTNIGLNLLSSRTYSTMKDFALIYLVGHGKVELVHTHLECVTITECDISVNQETKWTEDRVIGRGDGCYTMDHL